MKKLLKPIVCLALALAFGAIASLPAAANSVVDDPPGGTVATPPPPPPRPVGL